MGKWTTRFANILGTMILFGSFVFLAFCIHRSWGMTFDRALLFATLFAVAQGRWFQQDKSPVGKSEKP